jgi:hypothetical protein
VYWVLTITLQSQYSSAFEFIRNGVKVIMVFFVMSTDAQHGHLRIEQVYLRFQIERILLKE